MSQNYNANPINAPLISKPGESNEFVGSRNVTDLLPIIFRTDINKKFLDVTLEQLMSSGSLQAINAVVGHDDTFAPGTERYLDNNRGMSDAYQFMPGATNKSSQNVVTSLLSYDDLLNSLEFNESIINQPNKLFNEPGYTLDLPINYDMFINYHRYHWLLNSAPVCYIAPRNTNPITIDDIVGQVYYTTPTLKNNKTLELQNGMKISFSRFHRDQYTQTNPANDLFSRSYDGSTTKIWLNNVLLTEGVDYVFETLPDVRFTVPPALNDVIVIDSYFADTTTNYEMDAIYIVDGVGQPDGIKLTPQFLTRDVDGRYLKRVFINQTIYSNTYPSKFDAEDDSFEYKPFDTYEYNTETRDYVVEERWATDQSAWARTNLWIKEDVIHAICNYNVVDPKDYISELTRAVRPIIEYRANIEKYDFGKNHIANVEHLISDMANPAVSIIGETTWDYASWKITTNWTETGYEYGDLVKVDINGFVTYWECIETHTESANPSYYENRLYWKQIFTKQVEDGHKILFLECGNATYNNKIFTVGGVEAGTGITLTLTYDSSTLSNYDKVLIENGYNIIANESKDTLVYNGSEWYWLNNTWIYGQQKEHKSQGMKANLYDTNLVALTNTTVYPNNNFRGDIIFDYEKGTGVVDDALGFSPVYVDYGNNPGFNFKFGLGANRYTYNLVNDDLTYQQNNDTVSIDEITGFYYYKNLETSQYNNGWSLIRNDQPVERHIRFVATDSSSSQIFNIGTADVRVDNKFRLFSKDGKVSVWSENTLNNISKPSLINGKNPELFLRKGETYIFQTMFDITDLEFVNIDGSAGVSGITVTSVDNYTVQVAVNSVTTTAVFKYRVNANTGIIYLYADTNDTNLKVYVDGVKTTSYSITGNNVTVSGTFTSGSVIELFWNSYSDLDVYADGEFHGAPTHLYNPQNDWLETATFGDLQQHIKSQMTSIPGFTGNYFGDNNYNKLPHIHQFGGTIRQQPYSTELLSQVLMDSDTNPFASVRYASDSYVRFRQNLINKVVQLHNTSIDTVPVYELVDNALTEINIGKNVNSPFANTNMLLYTGYEDLTYSWTTGESKIFNLPNIVNTYNDYSNHIQVWIRDNDGILPDPNWRAIVNGVDYTVTNNKINITAAFTPDANSRVLVYIRWYPIGSLSFMPPSAVKLGLVKPYAPATLSNYDYYGTGSFNNNVIQCHDGSIHLRTGSDLFNRNSSSFNIVDAAVWEIESRIYNNLNIQLDEITDYRISMPNNNRPTPYSWEDFNDAMITSFNSWKTKNSISSLTDNSYYSGANRFTWNYKSVYPYIGGWKGVYAYLFNTDRPHTHPWEMMGYSKKPTWWDTYYTWLSTANGGNDAKRTALIEALKYGHYNNPADAVSKYDVTYSYSFYDWDNDILVTTAGILNDPYTANATAEPTSKSADFEYGDWGPIEDNWRNSQEYPFARILGLMRVRPLWTINNYINVKNRTEVFGTSFVNAQIINNETKLLGNYKNTNISYTKYEDSIIENIKVLTGGSGYSSTPVLTVYGNYGSGAAAVAIVEGGTVVGVSVSDPGKNYQSKPTVLPSTGIATFEVSLIDNQIKVYDGLNMAIAEFAIYNNTAISDIVTRFETLSFLPILKTSGFINKNNQNFMLVSSQNKGRVTIPEENYQSVLYKNSPNEELFYGAVIVTKTSTGYKISGYDNSNGYFTYFKPNYGSRKTIISAGGQTVTKYKEYTEIPVILSYNTEFYTIQSVYEFILGYGNYLNSEGWVDDWSDVAGSFVNWTLTATTTDVLKVIPNTTSISISEGVRGYFDNINTKYDGVYNIIDTNGRQILTNKVVIERQLTEPTNSITTIKPKSTDIAIYGVRFYKVEIEHVIVFDNITNFDDIIYKPSLGQWHGKVIWNGSRTKGWNGKLYAPGFIINNDTIINNFDTTVRTIDEVYAIGYKPNQTNYIDTARFNIGYNKPNWANYTLLDDDTIFEFVKGIRKYKGTKYALNAFMRNTSLFGLTTSATLHEEWAIRTTDFGDTRLRNVTEFQINKDLLLTSPQVVRFIEDSSSVDVLTDIYIDITPSSNLLVTGAIGNNFETRLPKTYNISSISGEEYYKNDFITSGLPLTTETDYRVLTKHDFKMFPETTNSTYNFDGEWQDIDPWNNQTSYKLGDKILYNGRVWEMVDPDGASGLNKPNDPITLIGNVTLPVIPSSGQTLVIDGTTVNITKSGTSTSYNSITVTGFNDIGTTNVVTHGSTLILGVSATENQTITFSNVINTLQYQDIIKTGTVTNPTIQGSSTKSLIIGGISVLFNETDSATTNITAQTAYKTAFETTFVINTSTATALANNRISAIESIRSNVISTSGSAAWSAWLSSYFTTDAGININFLVNEYLSSVDIGYYVPIKNLITNDVAIINNTRNTTYNADNVALGTESVAAADISNTQSALNGATYVDDVTDWLVANINTLFAASTVVATTTSSVFRTYSLSQIISRINAAGIPNVTASNSGNKLRVTKTTATPSLEFSMTISADTANIEVGFNTTTQTIISSGVILTLTPNLSIIQVVDAINNAGITGIYASTANNANILLRIVSNNSQLYIGNGTANSVIGLNTGIFAATTSVTSSPVSSDITDIVEKINIANITGVVASNSNNRLKITSNNSTLIIGAGTANSTVGITTQTLTATQRTISNVFEAVVNGTEIFRKMTDDPHIFSIWVADNSEENNFSLGYDVYQTMDFGMYITKACAGINPADDAQIKVALYDSNTAAHNLQVGDYIFIKGSNTTPSIDGIHKVTGINPADVSEFYIDAYINTEGTVGNIYPIRSIRFSNYASLLSSYNTVNASNIPYYNFSGYRQNNQQTPIYAFVDNDGNGIPAVYRYYGSFNVNNGHFGDDRWEKVRSVSNQARNDLIENIKIYDAINQTLITVIEVYDPAKGIIPGFLDAEIDFKITADVALYNYNSLDGYKENIKAWGSDFVGTRWWDLSTAVFLDYEQGALDYQQNNWGRLFDGASIDIYEWTESLVLPDKWDELAETNTVLNGEVISGQVYKTFNNDDVVYEWTEMKFYNSVQNRTETRYYFWVKNKINFTGNRNYTVSQLANILKNPTAFDVAWCAASGSNNLLLGNIDQFVKSNSVIQINKIFSNTNSLPLTEWTLIHDADPASLIPEQLHIKIRDSLVGYNNAVRRFEYDTYSAVRAYQINEVVIDTSGNFYISIFKEYTDSSGVLQQNIGNTPAADTVPNYWRRIYKYELPADTPIKDIDVWMGQPLPDLNLHPFNRYGHLTRPNQSLYRDLVDARYNFIHTANSLLKDICVINTLHDWDDILKSTFVDGTVTYDLKTYWTYVDWAYRSYNPDGSLLSEFVNNQKPDIIVSSRDDLYPALGEAPIATENGTLVYVRNVLHSDNINRPEIYELVNGNWEFRWKSKGTIKLSEELWNHSKFGHGFDVSPFDISGYDSEHSNIIMKVFDVLRNKIFVRNYKSFYNKLWFKCLYHAVTDNTTDDFAFKTTYTKLRVEHPLNTSRKTYQEYGIEAVEEFFNDIKPFHTKLHSSTEALTHLEENDITVSEVSVLPTIITDFKNFNGRLWAAGEILSGGTFTTVTQNIDVFEFTTSENDLEDIYDGNVFIQPVQEGWGSELYPVDFTENVRIRVQTNTSGSTVTSNTRTFQLDYFAPYNIEESTVIVDAAKTTLSSNINALVTTIPVVNATLLSDPGVGTIRGVVWINNERIEYGAVSGNNLLDCKRGTRGTSAVIHASGSTVTDASWKYRIPTPANFAHYGDDIRMAYNDTGISLSTAGISPEHNFIRNAGQGLL